MNNNLPTLLENITTDTFPALVQREQDLLVQVLIFKLFRPKVPDYADQLVRFSDYFSFIATRPPHRIYIIAINATVSLNTQLPR